MKSILFLLPIVLLLLSCDSQQEDMPRTEQSSLSYTDVSQLAGTGALTNFKATLVNLDGQEIKDQSQIKANGIYRILVESETPAHFRIKFADGFQVIETDNRREMRQASTTATFTIKANDDATSGIYVNIVPVHSDGSKLVRERSRNFMFPEKH